MLRVYTVALAVALVGASLSATVMAPTEFRDVVTDATLIVRGRVTDVRAVIVRGAGIESVASIAVDSVLKGQAGEFVSVRVPGGEIGRERFFMVGAPRLVSGEQAVFFLKRSLDNAWRPVGLTMGIYRVQAEPLSGNPVVDPPVVVGVTASVGQIVRGDARRRLMPLQEFESLVRLVMAGRASQPSAGGAGGGGGGR
jgi:hypothetical protein